MLAIGLHRKSRYAPETDLIEAECRRRVFWAAYSLDNYLGAALGRPRAFHDEDIDQVWYNLITTSEKNGDEADHAVRFFLSA